MGEGFKQGLSISKVIIFLFIEGGHATLYAGTQGCLLSSVSFG